MKTQLDSYRGQRGYVLILTLVFVGLGVLLLTTLMNWTAETSHLTDRNNQYYITAAAAEAATEKVLVHFSRDYINDGEATVYANLANYSAMAPTSAENPYWANFTFTNPHNGAAGVYVDRYATNQYVVLNNQYQGLYGYQSTYRIIANAALSGTLNANLIAAVQQYVGLESIPLFQFAIFYNEDLEMNPSPAMVVTGRVHANGNCYFLPATSLTFSNDVTSSGVITLNYKPGDPQGGRGISLPPNVIFDGAHDGGTSTLNLPIGTNGSSTNVYQILQIPPVGESASSPLGTNRIYNKADLVLLVSNTAPWVVSNSTVLAQGGPFFGGGVNLSNAWTNFMTVTNIIYNVRETTNVLTTMIDMAKLRAWITNSTNPLASALSAYDETYVSKIYIADMRSTPVVTNVTYTTNVSPPHVITTNYFSLAVESGVYLMNGSNLPPAGMTIATPNPLYVRGDYNVTTNNVSYSRSVNSTAYTVPAALMADAIFVLSTNWTDANSAAAIGSRGAGNTTVNAAWLTGIVPTNINGDNAYSGGVENLPRFLENWSGKTFWYNGSMVVMFNSFIAQVPWNSSANIYSPPTRNWAFDQNFTNENKIPPATPQILFMERVNWAFQSPNTVPP